MKSPAWNRGWRRDGKGEGRDKRFFAISLPLPPSLSFDVSQGSNTWMAAVVRAGLKSGSEAGTGFLTADRV